MINLELSWALKELSDYLGWAKNIIKGGNLVCSDWLFVFKVSANFLVLNFCLFFRGFCES